MNPLDQPGTVFKFGARNPNPSSSRTKAGPVYRVSLELDREDWQCFMDARDSGLVLAIHAAVVPDTGNDPIPMPKPTQTKGPYGKEAETLFRCGFFLAPPLLQRLGTDAEFLACLRTLQCAICKAPAPSEAAHVRRIANGSGMGTKPLWSCIPLCGTCHQRQHSQGESAIGGRDKVDRLRAKYLSAWAKDQLCDVFEVDSLTKIKPKRLARWCADRNLIHLLPREYRAEINLEEAS